MVLRVLGFKPYISEVGPVIAPCAQAQQRPEP